MMEGRMTKTGNAATGADMAPPIQSLGDVELFWQQTQGWIASHYLSIAIACASGALIIALLYGLRMLGTRLCRREHLGHWPRIVGRAIARTNLFFIVMLAARLVSGYATPPAVVAGTIGFLFTVATAVQAALWVRELVIGIVEYRAGEEDGGSSTLGSAIGIIRLLVTAVCFIVATLLILDNIGVNITGLVASLGIGGIAIGLAAQGIFSDLFASLAIIFDKPFRRGDTVKWDLTTGTVESIGLKTTRVRSTTGEEVVISNTNLLNKELRNLAHTLRRRATLMLSVTYQTPPEVCRRIPDMVKAIVTAHDKAVFLHCCMVNFAPSSLDYELLFDVLDEDGEVFNSARHDICITILESFAKQGIRFAYPTQTTFTAAPDGTMIMPYAEAPTPAA
ncbi:mechanosensitive ion channel protein MscS [Rhizorhabdus wittichii DC-6]|jgi:small-conductance mechanosensitive channel|uniref:Mechanosensitive ion channel family protein n=1 Tax=Rhizorhabdus wittichii TaxID=160791 RepID=A0A975HE92_9SPHN|nr:mechanosensitive ion channel protein MscS [Rhizorhabdus wittichii DC-6]QTH22231.1 mechanosensitive ion channel family protein [Rhizorhabdus wittichii]